MRICTNMPQHSCDKQRGMMIHDVDEMMEVWGSWVRELLSFAGIRKSRKHKRQKNGCNSFSSFSI